MLRLAISLVHNRGPTGNRQQIDRLRAMLEEVRQDSAEDFDPDTGIPKSIFLHYRLPGLSISHEVKVFQVVPFGEARPDNMDDLRSHNVLYGRGDEDKVGDHPRFWNWSLKRGTDQGAEVVWMLENLGAVNLNALEAHLRRLMTPDDPLEFVDAPHGKVGTLRLLLRVGDQRADGRPVGPGLPGDTLRESLPLVESIVDLKRRIEARGLAHG